MNKGAQQQSSQRATKSMLYLAANNLRHDQAQATIYLRDNEHALLLADCGTGKTIVALTAFRQLLRLRRVKSAIVFAGAAIVRDAVWQTEATKWSHVVCTTFMPLVGTVAQRQKALATTAEIYLCSYDNMAWLLAQPEAWRFDLAIFDEVSALKDTATIRFKSLRKNLAMFPRRWGLTATPCANDLLDIFGVAYAVAGAVPFGKSKDTFKKTYFAAADYMEYKWVPREDTEARIYKAIAPFTFRVPRGTVAMPALVPIERPVALPAQALDKYRQMEKNGLFTLIDANVITAANAAVATFKLQQVLSGAIYNDKHETQHVHDARLDAVAELVGEMQGERVVVTYWFEHELARLRKRFPAALVVGEQSTAELWGRGVGTILLAQTRAAAYGLDWLKVNCCRLIWYTNVWSLELHNQMVGRLQREGQASETVWVWYMHTPDSVDGVCTRARSLKGTRQTALLAAMTEYRMMGKMRKVP